MNQQELSQEILNQFFEEECLCHKGPLYNLARYLTSDENDADDLFQETLMRGFQFFHKYEAHTNCKAWLVKIMKNLFINHYRKKKRQLDTVSYDNTYNPEVEKNSSENNNSTATNPESFVLNEMLSSEITYALSLLPDNYRNAVILADLEYLSYQEMSDMLGCPIGTIRSRLSRGRKMLKKLLRDFAIEEGVIKEDDSDEEENKINCREILKFVESYVKDELKNFEEVKDEALLYQKMKEHISMSSSCDEFIKECDQIKDLITEKVGEIDITPEVRTRIEMIFHQYLEQTLTNVKAS